MNNTVLTYLLIDMTTQVFPLLNAIQPLTGAENYPQWRFAMEDILTLTEAKSYRYNGMDIVNGRWNITATNAS
jgi:hypothetical protein